MSIFSVESFKVCEIFSIIQTETIMAKVIIANVILFVIIGSIWGIGMGIDLKKQSSWLLGLYAFISGFLAGFVRSDGAGGYEVVTNLTTSLQLGLIFSFVYMVGGAITRWQKNMAEKYLARSEQNHQEKLENLAENLFKDKSNRK